MNIISFHDSHAYPGCAVTLQANIPAGSTQAVDVMFSDDATTTAILEQINPHEANIFVAHYTTARGTRIPAKNWHLKYDTASELWKVAARI